MPDNDAETEAPDLDWQPGDLPVSRRYGDAYYSATDGLAEARHVFLAGNRLAARFQRAEGYQIAELGFGTGLNMLAAWALWQERAAPGAVLRFTSFERHPMGAADMARALARWPELAPRSEALLSAWPVSGAVTLPGLRLLIVPGDARETVPAWTGLADAWFLDGFAPARNPEMWEPALLSAVFARTRPGGTAATFSAAGAVRRGLAAAGFEVSRARGFGPKREMLTARRP